MKKNLEDLLLDGLQATIGVSPSMYLNVLYPTFVKVMRFIAQRPQAAYADRKLREIFSETNWALDAHKLEAFFQLVGELQFWMLAEERGVHLERVSEGRAKTPDFREIGDSENSPRFEVKTLSVQSGWRSLAQMAEESFETQLQIQRKINGGAIVATGIQSIAPHGDVPRGKEWTEMCKHLISKATSNIKMGQYSGAPTFLALNLMLIDGHFNGSSDVRPVAPGYPDPWSVHTGVMWTTGFGTLGQIVHGQPEFEGKPGIEGTLGCEGVLINPDHEGIAGLIFVVHRLGDEPTLYGLMHSGLDDGFEANDPAVLAAFRKLVKHCWNDEVDSNGWQLTSH